MYTVRFKLDSLVRQLQAARDREYHTQEIAERTGLSRATVTGIMKNQHTRVDLATIGKLIQFFSDEGMPITIDRLFEVQDQGLFYP